MGGPFQKARQTFNIFRAFQANLGLGRSPASCSFLYRQNGNYE